MNILVVRIQDCRVPVRAPFICTQSTLSTVHSRPCLSSTSSTPTIQQTTARLHNDRWIGMIRRLLLFKHHQSHYQLKTSSLLSSVRLFQYHHCIHRLQNSTTTLTFPVMEQPESSLTTTATNMTSGTITATTTTKDVTDRQSKQDTDVNQSERSPAASTKKKNHRRTDRRPNHHDIDPRGRKRPPPATTTTEVSPNNDDEPAPDSYATRTRTINRGSYAHEPQRQLFHITPEMMTPITTTTTGTTDTPKRSKKKVTMLIGYLGTNYGGFQMNEGVRTVQATLELALYRHHYISPSNFGVPQKYSWSTSGRTDKGVHAAAQVVSFKMELLPTEEWSNNDCKPQQHIIDTINSALPSDIRVFDLQRTSRGFSAKLQRDYVQYRYLIPSIWCHPNIHDIFHQHIVTSPVPNECPPPTPTNDTTHQTDETPVPSLPANPTNQTNAPWFISKAEVRHIYDDISNYRSTTAQRELLQQTVRQYIGTHSFHHFTKRCRSTEARSSRYIMDFIVDDEPIVLTTTTADGTRYEQEWIPTRIIGQSFLLNQIRKMVWLAVEITRGALPSHTVTDAFQKTPLPSGVRIGMAPAQGLFLDMSYYKNYNSKIQQQRSKHSSDASRKNDSVGTLDWHLEHTVANQRWKEFRDTVITQHIGSEEIHHGNFLQHIYMQEHRSFFFNDFSKEEEEEQEDNDDDEEAEEVE